MSLMPNLRARAQGKPLPAAVPTTPTTPPEIIAATLEAHFQSSAMAAITPAERQSVSVALTQASLKWPVTECFLHVRANELSAKDRVEMFQAIALQLIEEAQKYAGGLTAAADAATPFHIGLRVLTRWIAPPLCFDIGAGPGGAASFPASAVEAHVVGMTPASAE